MVAINLTITSKAGGKLFRFDTAKAKPPIVVDGQNGSHTGAAITDKVLTDGMQAMVRGLYEGAVSYDHAQSVFAEMHRRGLISGTDLRVVLS